MKYIFKIILIFLLLTFPIFSYSESNIAYINMDVLINKSKVGQSITKALEVKQNQNMKEFKKIEEDLKKQENEIISQKNILNEEDYQKKVIELRKNAEDYRSKRKAKLLPFFCIQAIFVTTLSFICANIFEQQTIIWSQRLIIAIFITGIFATLITGIKSLFYGCSQRLNIFN